ncbi:hypothetical protein [Acidovorax sp. Root70]|uniref:hypothetical protein n=1 Tax=Acidovorax sp. Root70 TaxID=1736590 RepID=UPI000A450C0A|nr:hypothetical protein [Acidovorax sp. Root70]
MSTYAELLAQKKILDEQIANARKDEAEAALRTILQLVQEFGVDADRKLSHFLV